MSKNNNWISKQNILAWTIFIFFGVVLLTSYFYQAQANPKVSLCIFYNLTQVPCPGCGLTRSFCSIAKGKLIDSFYFHGLGPIMFLGTSLSWGASLLSILGVKKPFDFFKTLSSNETFIKFSLLSLGLHWLVRLGIIFLNSFS